MAAAPQFKPGDLVKARGREWVVLPEPRVGMLKLRPLGGAENDATIIYLPLEAEAPAAATFTPPNPEKPGSQEASLLLRDALRLKLRAGAGPFRSFGNLSFTPRAYQLVPLMMALKLDPIRLLIADDVGIGKTIEAGLIARELIDRGEIDRLTVICPPHLCEQWQQELKEKFSLDAEVVRTGTATRLERGLRPNESVFEAYPHTIVSLDYIKSDRRRNDFLRACPEFVIVDEAHTCVRANTGTRHQRYELLKGLAESEPRRGMVLLTATPHSGDDKAFHNLLGLLDPRFLELAEMPDGERRRKLRVELAEHFVQRRRGDIAEWKDAIGFPTRETREATYRLTGKWGKLFDNVLTYAREMVQRAEGGTKLQQRMSWWAALALLRCVSSSPAAALLALRTRLRAAEGETEQVQLEGIERVAGQTVMDEDADDSLTLNESVPAGTLEESKDAKLLRDLIDRAEKLKGPGEDTKLRELIKEVSRLVKDGFKPVVFCRYIATAHYVGEQLKIALPKGRTRISVVTGELTPEQRKDEIEELGEDLDEQAKGVTPILVATDCLSEGVNLQHYFDAVVHYDLAWNPTRHEQREGRADRFGQNSKKVRTVMLYGENNRVDGAVLQVILRKAEKIRKELGVAVPLPADNNKVVEAILEAVLLRGPSTAQPEQGTLAFEAIEARVEESWRTAKEKITRTVFAQQSLRPGDVLPEWKKTRSVLGGSEDVARFVRRAAERLHAPLEERKGYYSLPVDHLPGPLRDRLDALGLGKSVKIVFKGSAPPGAMYIHRTHPLVSVFSDHVAEQALDDDRPELGARASAVFTRGVKVRTTLYLLRLRSLIQVDQRGEARRPLLAEECLEVSVEDDKTPKLLSVEEGLALLSREPGRNMEDGQKTQLVRQALDVLPELEGDFNRIARQRADELLSDHRRIREASHGTGAYVVKPSLPVDVIGVYVLTPMASM